MAGLLTRPSVRRTVATSSAVVLRLYWAAITWCPSACSAGITLLKQEPSAQRPWQNPMLGLGPFIFFSFLPGCHGNHVNRLRSRQLFSDGRHAATTPAATVPLAVKRNWRRFGCSSFEEGLSFSIVDDLAGVRCRRKDSGCLPVSSLTPL